MAGNEDYVKAIKSQTKAIEHLCNAVHALIERYDALIVGMIEDAEEESPNKFGSLQDAAIDESETET